MSDDDDASTSLSRTRGRRSQADKSGRSDALERLKNARAGGVKHKYEVKEVDNVYDVVDESTYSRKVSSRLGDDWIVDDGTGDYVEDGREIFDDDINDRDEDSDRRKPRNKKEKSAKKAELESHKANIRDMLSSMPAKRKRPEMTFTTLESSQPEVTGDDLLGDFLADLKAKPKKTTAQTPPGFVRTKVPDDGTLLETPTRSLETDFARPKPVSALSHHRRDDDELDESPGSKRRRYTIRKKKFVPFGAPVEKSPSVSSTSAYDDFGDSFDNGLETNDFDDHEPSTSNGVSNGNKSSSTATTTVESKSNVHYKNGVTEKTTTSASTIPKISSIHPKPSFEPQKRPRRFASLGADFRSCGQIENGALDSTNFEDMAVSFDDDEEKDSKIVNFFWLDMFEEPKNPGVLYLFGKVQATPGNYVSACVTVKDLSRSVHLLIRDYLKSDPDVTVDGMDVYNEFNQVFAPKYKINEFKSRPVKKRYCFDFADVPSLGHYIEIRYSGTLPPIPADLSGETFSHVFGTGTPLMENFLLEKKLKGPSWLKIRNPQEVDAGQRHSWCRMELSCTVSDVKLNEKSGDLKIPPVILASINIQATSDANSKKDTVVFVGVAVHKMFELQKPLKTDQLFHDYFCLINKPPGEIWPLDVDQVFAQESAKNNASKMDSERALLACLLAKLQQIDADIYVGHDLNFELLLLHLFNLKVPHWSRLGRLKRATTVGKNGKPLDYKSALAGRLFCDVKISAKELIRARSYDFQNLAQQVLGVQTETLTGPEMKEQFESAAGLQFLINWGMQHCIVNIRLVNELQVMPLALQITTIAGNTLFRTLLGGRSERNEYLLLHAFHSKGYIVPDKYRPFVKTEEETKDKKNSGPSYAGGMVLDPKKGFYDNYIVLMDFNSLYPSIIQEFNICFTTRGANEGSEEHDDKGILPEEIRKLVESRRQVKGLMKNPSLTSDQLRVYDIRQMAFKLTANSMYGCLGFKNSRFFAKELAARITGYGRDILLKTKEAVERMGFEVIYGDTDSLMINSNTTEVKKVYAIGAQIKTEVNKMYKLLELELDGIFRFLLLLKKKKYAALVYNQKPNGEISTSLELKGLDMVRRDWAPIASNTARLVLDEIMTEQTLDEKVFKICKILNEIAGKLKMGDIQLKDLLITKQLAKNPEEYKDAHGLYHVVVALRMNKSGTLAKKFRNGDTVPYLFCTDGLPHHLSELSVMDDPADETRLTPDPTYYLAHQIHPVVSRICEPIEGLDAGRIAEELGMDATGFKRRRIADEEDKALGQESEAEKFVDCEKFKFACPRANCGEEIVYESMFIGKDSSITFALMTCPSCGGSLLEFSTRLSNVFTLFLRKFVTKYYSNDYICEDPTCDNVERFVPFKLINGFPPCRKCGIEQQSNLMCKEYREGHLYKQLSYLYTIFDYDKQLETVNTEAGKAQIKKLRSENTPEVGAIMGILDTLKSLVSQRLHSSAYSEIKLDSLFQDLFPKDKAQLENYR